MVYPALGMLAGIWLVTSVFMNLEPGVRGDIGLAVGAAALVLSPVSYWSPLARRLLAVLGFVLGLANIVLAGPVAGEAAWTVAIVALLVAGTSPMPVKVATA